MFIFTHNKERLLEHFRQDPVLFAYHIGDLDDFFFDRCQWAATYYKSTRIDECLLVYNGPATPTVLAFGLSNRFPALLDEALELLPERFYCHFLEPYRAHLAERYTEQPLGTHIKMKLGEFTPRHGDNDPHLIRSLTVNDLPELTTFYKAAYPESYFDARMLETGKCLGCFDDGRLLAAAGIHVFSEQYNVAVLGNIATLPEHRGNGLATQVTSHLVADLTADNRTIALNVKADNAPAIACYESLGFAKTHDYEESLFTAE